MNNRRYIHLLWGMFLAVTICLGNENTDLLRPQVDLDQQDNSTTIHITFPASQNLWEKMLADPEAYSTYGYGFSGGPGAPAYPAFTILVPIATDIHTKPQVSTVSQSVTELQSISIRRTPTLRKEEQAKAPIEISEEASNLMFGERFNVGEPTRMGDQNILPITIFPLNDNGTGALEALTEIQLEVESAPLHPNDMASIHQRTVPTPDGIFEQLGAYLIVTPPGFQPYLANLIAWKKRQGHPVTVVTTDQFSPLTAESIRSYILNAYLTWETPPRYVLLVGDNDQGMRTFVVQSPEGLNRVTDFPYTLLTDDDDFPELMVGRLSVDSYNELLVVSAKIIRYESNPWIDASDWFKKGLMICSTESNASTASVKNWVRRKMLEKGFTQVDTAYFPNQSMLSFITHPINTGVGFINYRGYGYYGGWAGPYFNSDNIDQLNNGWRLPVVTSIVCGGGNFGAPDDPCFGEKWIRAGTTSSPKGAVAFFGPSELYTHVMYNNAIDIGIYHAIFDDGITELGEALWQGKLELWRNYHQNTTNPFGQSPEYYFHIYNLLGDPGLTLWTDVPQEIFVSHPASLQFGDRSVSVHVTDSDGAPVTSAFVFLQNTTNALGYHTDDNGDVTLPVVVDGNPINLTVTGQNLKPYLTTIAVDQAPHDLAITDVQWNENNPLIAGESIVATLTLEGGSENLEEVEFSLECNSPWVSVTQSQMVVPTLDAGVVMQVSTGLALQSNIHTPDSTLAFARLIINTGSETWSQEFPLVIHGPRLVFQPPQVMFGTAAPGDSISCHFSVQNIGSASAPAGSGAIEVPAGVWCSATTLSWDALGPGEQWSETQAISLTFSESLFPGDVVTVGLITDTGILEQSVTLRAPGRYDPSGTDDYGYRVFSDEDIAYSKVPIYNWYEIDRLSTGPGFPLPITDTQEDDDDAVVVNLPFPVKYYGQVYTQVTVCSNGWVAMGNSPEVSFRNRTIPSPTGPTAMIAPFWDDLYTSPGRVSHYTMPDFSQYILEWREMANAYTGQLESFQVIFYNDTTATPTGDTEIKFQYQYFHNVDGYENFATIGIESPDANTGIQVSYANQYDPSCAPLSDGHALLFTTDKGTRLPAAVIMLNTTTLDFTTNPWDWQTDSITITNVGESSLLYTILQTDGNANRTHPVSAGWNATLPAHAVSKFDPEPLLTLREAVWDTTDAFGYTWRGNGDAGCPAYNWVNIESPENMLENPENPDDVRWGPIPIGFDYSFYGESYPEFWISSNGFISFSEFTGSYYQNMSLPNAEAPINLIAAWWDDLNGGSPAPGQIFVWNNGIDSSIVTFKNMPRWGTSLNNSFQIILEINGNITLQYEELLGPRTSATIGIQNGSADVGLTILSNNLSDIGDRSVIQISRPDGWFVASVWNGIIAAGESGYFPVNAVVRGMSPGDYSIPLHLVSNAGNEPDVPININLHVQLGTPPPGDVNLDYQVNILDVSLMLDMILQRVSATPVQIIAGDLHPDGACDVLDLVALLELIFQ